jgi:hypothetical protein
MGSYSVDPHVLASALDGINQCVQVATSCADLCLVDEACEDLRSCVRACLDVADVGRATAAVASRFGSVQPAVLVQILEACAVASAYCAEQCDTQERDYLEACAMACRRCVSACRALASNVGGRPEF